MRIAPQNSKKIISVLGMPHAGTTIVCNIFNSMKNAFCLSEPHWTLLSNPGALRLDKAHDLKLKNPDEVFPKIKAKLKSDDRLQFAGLKETYRPKEPRMKKYFAKMLRSDVIVFVFREPKAHYNSFKLLSKQHNRNPMPIQYMINSFNSIYDTAIASNNGIFIMLEDLCDAGNKKAIKYINDRSKGLLCIRGAFEINPTNYIYGNHKANRSKQIAPANMAETLLTPEEIKIINKELLPKYKELKG